MEVSEGLEMAIKRARCNEISDSRLGYLLRLQEKAEKGLLDLPEDFIVAEIDSGVLVLRHLNHLPHNLESSNCFIVVPEELGSTVKVHNYQDGVEIIGQGYVWYAADIYDPHYNGAVFEEEAIDHFLNCYKEDVFSLNLHIRE